MARTWVALLRGINVGGKNKLPMKELAAIFGEAGCSAVRTYIASGNVLFGASADLAARLPAVVAKKIAARFELEVPVVVRGSDELAALVRDNPFLAAGADPATLAVMFLADKPTAQKLATLDAGRSVPDEYIVRGRDIYLRLRNGFAETKLTNAYFDSKLATVSTARNWRTVLKLNELSQP
ncbi:MAG: hypothetical protein JWN44_4061 [Myxococcales bacterium]|nr:hypothetical protein [Myxococcales bacterium]